MRIIKTTLAFLFLGLIAFTACRKHSNATGVPGDAEYFIFGSVGGFCPTVCAQYYKIMGNKLYKSYVDTASHIQYTDSPMPADKYTLALPAMTNFPAWFSLHPNQDVKCANCADMGFIHLEYKRGGQVYQWNIDYPYEGIPAEIQAYIDQVSGIMSNLQ